MKKFLSIILPFAFVGCSSVSFSIPSGRMISPEANGQLVDAQGDIRLTGATRSKITVTSQGEDKVSYNQALAPGAYLDLGLLKRLDIYIALPYDSPGMTGLKFQFLGKPRKENQKGWKASIVGAWGRMEEESSDFDIFAEENGIKVDSYKITSSDLGAIIGYRKNEKQLFYLGSHITLYELDSVTNQSGIIINDHESEVISTQVGFIYNRKDNIDFKLEVSGQRINWDFGKTEENLSASLAIGVRLDDIINKLKQ